VGCLAPVSWRLGEKEGNLLRDAVAALLPSQCCLAWNFVQLVAGGAENGDMARALGDSIMDNAISSNSLKVLTQHYADDIEVKEAAFRGLIRHPQKDLSARQAGNLLKVIGPSGAGALGLVEVQILAAQAPRRHKTPAAPQRVPTSKGGTADVDAIELTVPYYWVDSQEGLEGMARTVMRLVDCSESLLLGIDTEWGEQVVARPSIVQLAVQETVWVVDTLSANLYEPGKLQQCLKSLFSHTKVICVAWSFHNDKERLCGLLGHDLEFATLLDLQCQACKHLGSAGNMPSLAHCCSALIGKKLDKRQQCSDWNERPLSVAQLEYAALDAHVLLELHNALWHPRPCMADGHSE